MGRDSEKPGIVPNELDTDALKELLSDTVEGLEELEILAWFERAQTRADADRIARETGTAVDTVRTALSRLGAAGLVCESPSEPRAFEPSPDDAVQRRLALVLGEYRANPVRVMKLMTENAIERVRNAALRTFAESFRIRGGNKDG
jgi:hypothetical protein